MKIILVVIRDSTEDHTLHGRYIEAAAQFIHRVIDDQNVPILAYNEVIIQADDAEIATALAALSKEIHSYNFKYLYHVCGFSVQSNK